MSDRSEGDYDGFQALVGALVDYEVPLERIYRCKVLAVNAQSGLLHIESFTRNERTKKPKIDLWVRPERVTVVPVERATVSSYE